MAKAHEFAARQVATIREQFRLRQDQINEDLGLILERARTMENFVAADLQRNEDRFQVRSAELSELYGNRIAMF